MSTPKPNYSKRGGRWRLLKRGRRYTPALDQVPMTAHQRNLRRFQDLVVAYPHNNQLREDYWRQLSGPAPPDVRQPVEQIIKKQTRDTVAGYEFSKRVRAWAWRITRVLYFVRWYR